MLELHCQCIKIKHNHTKPHWPHFFIMHSTTLPILLTLPIFNAYCLHALINQQLEVICSDELIISQRIPILLTLPTLSIIPIAKVVINVISSEIINPLKQITSSCWLVKN